MTDIRDILKSAQSMLQPDDDAPAFDNIDAALDCAKERTRKAPRQLKSQKVVFGKQVVEFLGGGKSKFLGYSPKLRQEVVVSITHGFIGPKQLIRYLVEYQLGPFNHKTLCEREQRNDGKSVFDVLAAVNFPRPQSAAHPAPLAMAAATASPQNMRAPGNHNVASDGTVLPPRKGLFERLVSHGPSKQLPGRTEAERARAEWETTIEDVTDIRDIAAWAQGQDDLKHVVTSALHWDAVQTHIQRTYGERASKLTRLIGRYEVIHPLSESTPAVRIDASNISRIPLGIAVRYYVNRDRHLADEWKAARQVTPADQEAVLQVINFVQAQHPNREELRLFLYRDFPERHTVLWEMMSVLGLITYEDDDDPVSPWENEYSISFVDNENVRRFLENPKELVADSFKHRLRARP